LTEQLTRKQLREARQAGVAVSQSPDVPNAAGDDASQVTSLPVATDPDREFQLSGPFAQTGDNAVAGSRAANAPSFQGEGENLSPDELLRRFRERIRNNYQDGSIPMPRATLPKRAESPLIPEASFDIESIRQRLREAAEAARTQQNDLVRGAELVENEISPSEPMGEISEYDLAAKPTLATSTVDALRESFASQNEVPSVAGPETDASLGELDSSLPSRRNLRLQVASQETPAPFSQAVRLEYAEAAASVEVPVSESAPTPIEMPMVFPETEAPDFMGNNLLAEPSTQSIVLDIIPDAVTMPIGMSFDSLATGSISIIPEQSVADITGAISGIQTDNSTLKDTVTGAISVIEPVSALAVIAERRHHSVLPMTSLRRGWWQPYAVAFGILAMLGAAGYAVFLILEVLNS